jgi:hypothetical protein
MEWDVDQKIPGCWCIAARLIKTPPAGDERRSAIDLLAGSKVVYCMPPARNDPEAEMQIIGYTSRLHRLVRATLLASHLRLWQAEYITDKRVRAALSPPWDDTEDSRAMASLLCSWHEGGPWPAYELRDWNRTRAQRTVGRGGFVKRLIHRFFGKSKHRKRKSSRPKSDQDR